MLRVGDSHQPEHEHYPHERTLHVVQINSDEPNLVLEIAFVSLRWLSLMSFHR